jgi:hypothetical protein
VLGIIFKKVHWVKKKDWKTLGEIVPSLVLVVMLLKSLAKYVVDQSLVRVLVVIQTVVQLVFAIKSDGGVPPVTNGSVTKVGVV